uniref:RNase H type-1 domain-containing protein n=1 Tax=Cannabis sativa TaxID=3483 RepID=A0A803Q9B2_CANSA
MTMVVVRGSGCNISVLGEPWLPELLNPQVVSDHPRLVGTRVCNLMKPRERSWDEDLTHDMFVERDWRLIKNIPLQSIFQLWFNYEPNMLMAGISTVVRVGQSFFDWCVVVFYKASTDLMCIIAATCWAIWGAKNDLVWKGNEVKEDNIVVFANRYLEQWRSAQSSEVESSWPFLRAEDVPKHWTVPCGNTIKVNVDATLFNNIESYGLGMVTCDASGLLIQGRTKLLSGMVELIVAEAIGVREVLSWIKDSGWSNVHVEIDCLSVVQAIQGSLSMISLFGLVI